MTAAAGAPIAERIHDHYEQLTKREQRLADTVLARLRDFAGYTATELAEHASVSKATATRFFRRLGYADFEEARREERRSPYPGSPLEAFDQALPGAAGKGEVDRHVASEVENIRETFRAASPTSIKAATELIARAATVWVVGFRDSYGLAVQADLMLTRLVADVRLLPRLGMSLAEDLGAMRPGDVVVAIGFRRRPQMFAKLLEAVSRLGARIILIADDAASVPVPAEVTFRCLCGSDSALFDSYAAGLSLINLLCSNVGHKLGPATRRRLEGVERLHESFDDFAF